MTKTTTCIIGIEKDNTVYIGADTAGVAGYNVISRRDSKVFKGNQDIIYGCTTSFRMMQIIRFAFDPGKPDKNDLFKWMVTTFIDKLRASFKTSGYLHTENGVDEGGTFLVGVQGKLFTVEGDFQIGMANDYYDSVGCGESFAKGSLFSTPTKAPLTRIDQALKAAAYFSGAVCAPFDIISAKYAETTGEVKRDTVVKEIKYGTNN